MRVGKWVPIYKRKFPIPQRLAMAFGLAEGSALHLVPITDEEDRHRHGFEIIVSPVPPASWRSVCRLSVRLLDQSRALATATRFLSDKRINILFSESSSTIAHRAHWDAICDLSAMPAFAEIATMSHDNYTRRMPLLLQQLSADLDHYMNQPECASSFPKLDYRYGEFSLLTGLNNASFLCDFTAPSQACRYTAGGIEISEKLARIVSNRCGYEAPRLPEYAMITGNTEQRYLRVLFLRDYRSLFKVKIEITTTRFAGGGIGILNQILSGLPKQVNLIRTSSRIVGGDGTTERGWTDIIAHWDEDLDLDTKQAYIKDQLTRLIPAIKLQDIDGKTHENALRVVDFDGPETIYPRVYVSYSTRSDPAKLTYLVNMLWDSHFRPVLGTDSNDRNVPGQAVPWMASGDVVSSSFDAIKGCVALVSLQLQHPDFRVDRDDGMYQYVVPPWNVAEEAWAWAHQIRVLRLRDEAVEEPRYTFHLMSSSFRKEDQFKDAVDEVLGRLNEFRASAEFATVNADARGALYKPWYPPGD